MTISSTDIHNVTGITIDEARELDGLNVPTAARHIDIRCQDAQGNVHHHTLTLFAATTDGLEITKL